MAIAAVNMSYIGQPSSPAQGQIVNSGLGGPLANALVGIGTATLDGAATTFTLNWIDGTQKIFQRPQVIVPVLSVTAPATIGGVANQAVYSGVGSYGQFRVGQSITFAGFSTAANNGAFTINALSTSSIQVTNASSVAETNPQASGSVNFGAVLPAIPGSSGVTNFRSLVSAANVADTAAGTITALISSVSATGCTVTISAAGSNGQTLSVLVPLYSVV
jgi:hypothetical protein